MTRMIKKLEKYFVLGFPQTESTSPASQINTQKIHKNVNEPRGLVVVDGDRQRLRLLDESYVCADKTIKTGNAYIVHLYAANIRAVIDVVTSADEDTNATLDRNCCDFLPDHHPKSFAVFSLCTGGTTFKNGYISLHRIQRRHLALPSNRLCNDYLCVNGHK